MADELLREAEAAVEALLSLPPQFRLDADQPDYRGGTNQIIFGFCGAQRVVFKYFVTEERWRNEEFCLRHFRETGVVPEVLHRVPERLLVMTRLPGRDLVAPAEEARKDHLSRQVGQALGKLAQTPLPTATEGYSPVRDFRVIVWGPDLREVLGRYVAVARRAQQTLPVYQAPFFDSSLALLETQVDKIARQRPMLFHEDISNARADGGEFTGFYDLEMCRLGTEALQMGAALGLCRPGGLGWPSIVAGYETETGRLLGEEDFVSVLAMNHFIHWIRICRWGWWDGGPEDASHRQASEEDADWYRERMTEACAVLRHCCPVGDWFPELSLV